MSSIKKNFLYNSFYQILVIIIPLITTPYISRVLGASKIGEYSFSYSIAYYFAIFILLGLNNYGNRTIAMVRENKKELSKTFIEIYAMQLIFGVLVLCLYILYCFLYSNNIISWIFTIYVLSAILDLNWFFFGMEEFKITVVRNTIIKVSTTFCVFLFVKSSTDLYLYALIMVVGMLVSQLILWPFITKYIYFVKVSMVDVIKHIKPNLVLFLPVIAVSLYKIMDKIMLGMLSDMEQVGYYESSEKIIQIPMALITSLGTVMLPKMSNLVANHNENKTNYYISNSIKLAMFLSTSMCFGLMAIAQYFVPLFFGNGYETCIYLFLILLPSCIFLAFANVIRTQYLIPNKLDKVYIKSVFLGACVNLIVNITLIPILKSFGAAIGTLVAEATVCIYQIIIIRNFLPIKTYLKNALLFFIPGIVMYLILQCIALFNFSNISSLIISILVGTFIYIIVYGICCLLSQRIAKKLKN